MASWYETMKLPEGFVDLATAYNAAENTFVNIIGVVVDVMPPTLTRNNEHMITFKLLDEKLRDSIYGSHGLLVRFFRGDAQHLPRVNQRGDVVLIRNIKMRAQSNQPLALSNYQTSPLVFPFASVPEPSYQISFQDKRRINCLGVPQDKEKLSLDEQRYVIELKHEIGSSIQPSPVGAPSGPSMMRKRPAEDYPPMDPKKQKQSTSSTFGRKFRLVQDLRHKEFADICGQVVKRFPTRFGGCDLYITDYTQNKDMFYYAPPEAETERERDGDEYGYSGPPKKTWPGPYGQLVLKVNMKDPHSYYANKEVDEQDLVLLKNVKMKIMAEGSKLEGDMWPDQENPEKVQIRKLMNRETPEIQALLERKDRYWAARAAKAAANEKPKLTHTEKKKQKKQRKAEQAAASAAKLNGDRNSESTGMKVGVNNRSKVDVNPHVRCGHEEVSISTIRDILDPDDERHTNAMPDGSTYVLPFVNAKFRARVRVVDFAPRQLEDFAIPEHEYEGERSEDSAMIDYSSSLQYMWSFSLLLEDASKPKGPEEFPNRIWATLGHEEAQYLFGRNVNDPGDLRNDHQLLARLREQLCILWGNLEEKATDEAVSNRPFECCLMEYGVEMDDDDPAKALTLFGIQRMHRMYGVTSL